MKTLPKIIVDASKWLVGIESVKASRAAPLRMSIGATSDLNPPPNIDTQLLAERVDANINTSVRILAGTIAQLPIDIMRKEMVDGKPTLIDDNDHEANLLIEEPNPYNTKGEMIEHMIQSLIITGNGYHALEKEKSTTVNEMWPLEPSKVRLRQHDTTGMPNGYTYRGVAGKDARYNLDEMWHARLTNINNVFYGRGRVEPVRNEIMTDFWIKIYNENFFKHGIRTSKWWSPDKDHPPGPDQVEMLTDMINAQHAGAANAHRIFISSMPGKLEDMTQSVKDIEFSEYLKLNREIILGVIGIPPMLAGVLEFSSYANALLQERVYWMYTIKPLLRALQQSFNKQVIWRHFDREHEMVFDLSGVEALRADKLKEAQAEMTLVTAGIKTPNESRLDLGLEELEGADELRVPASGGGGFGGDSGNTPSGDPNKEPNDSDEPGGEGDPAKKLFDFSFSETNGHTLTIKKPKSEVKSFDLRTKREAKIFAAALNTFLQQQLKRVVKNLDKFTAHGKVMTPVYSWTKDHIPLNPDPIFDIIAENGLLEVSMTPEIRRALMNSAEDFWTQANLDIAFDVDNPLVDAGAGEFFNRLEKINNITYNHIKTLLTDSIGGGDSLGKVVKKLKEHHGFSTTRAKLIARTESTGLVNRGTLIGYQKAGVTKKQWITQQDDTTREHHSIADGETVGVDAMFMATGWPMSAPGDASAPANQTANCRCTIVPVFDNN